jgi:hypothetical protein
MSWVTEIFFHVWDAATATGTERRPQPTPVASVDTSAELNAELGESYWNHDELVKRHASNGLKPLDNYTPDLSGVFLTLSPGVQYGAGSDQLVLGMDGGWLPRYLKRFPKYTNFFLILDPTQDATQNRVLVTSACADPNLCPRCWIARSNVLDAVRSRKKYLTEYPPQVWDDPPARNADAAFKNELEFIPLPFPNETIVIAELLKPPIPSIPLPLFGNVDSLFLPPLKPGEKPPILPRPGDTLPPKPAAATRCPICGQMLGPYGYCCEYPPWFLGP